MFYYPVDRDLELFHVARVGETHMLVGAVVAEIDTRCHRHALGIEQGLGPAETVVGEGAAIGVQIERTLRLRGNVETDLLQGRQQVVTTLPELFQPRIEDLPAPKQSLYNYQRNSSVLKRKV